MVSQPTCLCVCAASARSRFTMPKFISHENIAQGLLNTGHSTGTGHLQQWSRQLTNNDGLVAMLVNRLETDFVALAPKMRKAWGKDVETRMILETNTILGLCIYYYRLM